MLYVVGIGPGNRENMTFEALEALKKSSSVVGYKTYINLIEDLLEDKKVFSNGMRKELDRCKKALEIAELGENVSVVSSGDAGVFGMAGLVLEIISKSKKDVEVEIVPGVPSANGAAASLGAPLMHDYVSISLSDLLTPWKLIEKRIKLAAEGDFVICLYNPKSKGRPENLNKSVDIIMEYLFPVLLLTFCYIIIVTILGKRVLKCQNRYLKRKLTVWKIYQRKNSTC
ncbi:MAG: precorrin-3B C(17)-methyltransferase [Tissierellales bacterium]|nr:precorrin-3B C(17)-methyltransferase [Tissierellales bacterium]